MEPLPSTVQKVSPRRVESISPVGSLSPVDSGSLSPAEHERLSPALFKGYSPPELITGLSSANYHGKIDLGEVLPIPSGVHQIPQQNVSTGIPSGVTIKISAKYLFPQSNSPQSNRSNKFFPNGVIFSYRSILAIIIPSGNEELYSSNISPRFNKLPTFVKDLFS